MDSSKRTDRGLSYPPVSSHGIRPAATPGAHRKKRMLPPIAKGLRIVSLPAYSAD